MMFGGGAELPEHLIFCLPVGDTPVPQMGGGGGGGGGGKGYVEHLKKTMQSV